MKVRRRIQVFTDRYPLIGPIIWMLSVQYFIIQIIAGINSTVPYSIFRNTISDLGNTTCGIYGGRAVCSPLHDLMNASFITFGTTMALGSLLIYQEFKRTAGSLIGFIGMALAGLGTILVGLFPENTIGSLHVLGATMPFLVGNIAMILLGLSLPVSKRLRYYSILSGVIALIALPFFLRMQYLGLGEGGLERIVAYPQTLWLIVFGIYMSHSHSRLPRR